MGLKRENYEVKNFGLTLPEAYAIIDQIENVKESTSVYFGIYSKREDAKTYQPLEIRSVHFVWDRKSDLAKTAYELAKTRTEIQVDEEGNEVEVTIKGIFDGWEDDIVVSE